MNSRLPLKIAVPPKIADYRRWHFGIKMVEHCSCGEKNDFGFGNLF